MVFKYITPPYSKSSVRRYISILVYSVLADLRTRVPSSII